MEEKTQEKRIPKKYHLIHVRHEPNWSDGRDGSKNLICYITEGEEFLDKSILGYSPAIGIGRRELINQDIEYLGRAISNYHPFKKDLDTLVTEGKDRNTSEDSMEESDMEESDPQSQSYKPENVYAVKQETLDKFRLVLETMGEGDSKTNLRRWRFQNM